jgi:tetratricopeptide (TPR) repeat protein/Mrp family chromosome partitioning ATPase
MLENIDLFSNIGNTELLEIERITQSVPYSRGDYIFRQGDFSRDFYIIQNGQVELSITNIFKENKTIALLKNGEYFGEMALFDKNACRSLNAQVLQNSVLLKIPGNDFELLLSQKPAISFRLLGILSKRLKDSNERRGPSASAKENPGGGKVLMVASPRNGYGKTTFSTTLAQLLSNELGCRILYVDLDLYFGDGTYALGVFSPKSILGLAEIIKAEVPTWEILQKYLVKHNENLYILPAPKDFIEGEKVKDTDLASILKTTRKFFDYIVIDTDSSVNEIFLTAADVADQIVFLVDVHCAMSIRSDVRYFRGLSHLNLSPESCCLVATKVKDDFDSDQVQKLLTFRVIGILPVIKEITMDFGQSIYQAAPKSAFCEVLRTIFQGLFQNATLQGATEKGYFYRLFFPSEPIKVKDQASPIGDLVTVNGLQIANENCVTLLNSIRATISQGYWDKALSEGIHLLEIFPNSPMILQVLGEVCFYQRNFQLGIDALQKTLMLDPENHYAMGILGFIQLDENLKRKSLEIIQAKIKANPGFPDLYNDLGKLEFSFKNFKHAQEAFQKALKINPNFSEARVNYSVNFGEMQNFREAISQIIMVEPKNIRIFYLLGCFLYNLGNFCESFKAFTKVSDENARYLDVGEKLESLRGYFQRLANLMTMHQDLVKLSPGFPDLHLKIGNIFVLQGKNDEAIEEFEAALTLNPNYQEAREKMKELRSRESFHIEPVLLEPLSVKSEERFELEVSLENLRLLGDEKTGILHEFSLIVRNVRANKKIAERIPFDAFKIGLFLLKCQAICPIVTGDLLLVQLIDETSGGVVVTLPHIVSEDEFRDQKAKQQLATIDDPLLSFSQGMETRVKIPIQYFYVRFFCSHLAEMIGGEEPSVTAEIKVVNSGFVARGKCNADHPDETYFVLMSEGGKEVVREGDLLNFRLTDRQKNDFFSMDFPVLKEDIDDFSKTISVEFLESVLQGGPKLTLQALVAAAKPK